MTEELHDVLQLAWGRMRNVQHVYTQNNGTHKKMAAGKGLMAFVTTRVHVPTKPLHSYFYLQ